MTRPAGAVAPIDNFYCVLRKDDHYSMVNNKCVREVITKVMRICLEREVRGDVDQKIAEIVHKEKERNTKWFKSNGASFLTPYQEFDTTKLMDIITKVIDFQHKVVDDGRKSLLQSLRELKDIRNGVKHDIKVECSEQTLSHISDKVTEIIDKLGIVFNVDFAEVVSIKESFQEQLKAISNSQEVHDEKIAFAIKESVIKENNNKWVPMVKTSMKYDTLPFSNREILRSDIFHELEFEDIHWKCGDDDSQKLETFVCTDILSMKQRPNIDIIVGDSGSGKTAFLRMMCIDFCEKSEQPKFKQISSYPMMILINCRDRENICNFWIYFETHYRESSRQFPEEHIIKTLRDMKMIIAIDGLDEANESATALVRDVIHHFAGSETVKFLFTTRRGFSKNVEEQLDKKAVKYCFLNIKPIGNINDKIEFLNRVIKHISEVDCVDIIKTFKEKQVELDFHLCSPLGLMLFITLSLDFPDKIKELTHELSLIQLSYEMSLQIMTLKMPDVIQNPLQSSRAILKLFGQTCLKLIQTSNYKIDYVNYNRLADDCFEIDKNIPVESVLSCVLIKRKYEMTITEVHDFYHKNQQEYVGSKVLTEQLVKTRSGTVLEILRELTRDNVQELDLDRSVNL